MTIQKKILDSAIILSLECYKIHAGEKKKRKKKKLGNNQIANKSLIVYALPNLRCGLFLFVSYVNFRMKCMGLNTNASRDRCEN